MSSLDIEAVATQSNFQSVDGLALYIAKNTDVPLKKLARGTGLPPEEVERLLTSRQFRERLSEVLTYTELTPDKEVRILRRMLKEATSEGADFATFKDAATWVYRQGGVLRSEKAQVDVGGTIRVAFTLDPEAQHRPAHEARYVPPDPLAGVVGLLPSSAEVATEVTDVDFKPAGHARGPQGKASDQGEGGLE